MRINRIKQAINKVPLIVSSLGLMLAFFPGASAYAVSLNCPTDLLSAQDPTGNANYADNNSVNAGVKFVVHGAGFVSGAKFYKGAGNTGTHVAHLYDATTETDLATATFSNETATGWQTVNFSSAVDVDPSDTFYVWVSMPAGHYAVDGGFIGGSYDFSTSRPLFGGATDPMQLMKGVYSYSTNPATVPANVTNANYWVSPIVGNASTPGANTGFSATDATAGPSLAWTGTGYEANSVTTVGSPAATIITRQANGGEEQLISRQNGGGAGYLGATGSNGYTPNDPTALPGTNYTYRVKNLGGCGSLSTTSSATVTTASQSLENVFGSTAPASEAVTDDSAVTLGSKFSTDVNGQVWGVRFYRSGAAVATDQFRVYLWDANGTLLARTILAPNNGQEGWIDARFSSPVSISSGQNYTVGYYAPDGDYSYTQNRFSSAVSSTHVTMPADAGVFEYGLGYHVPTNTYNSFWYGVDVDFIPGL